MTTIVPFAIHQLERIDVPTPPADLFEELFGYDGDRRYVGFWYEGGNLYFEDGDCFAPGNWWPWLIWSRCLGAAISKTYFFGSDEWTAEHLLILDRETRSLYAGPLGKSREALRRQAPPSTDPPLVLSKEELEALAEKLFANLPTISDEQVLAEKKKIEEGMGRLKRWLDESGL